jgi:hypothetical protein
MYRVVPQYTDDNGELCSVEVAASLALIAREPLVGGTGVSCGLKPARYGIILPSSLLFAPSLTLLGGMFWIHGPGS